MSERKKKISSGTTEGRRAASVPPERGSSRRTILDYVLLETISRGRKDPRRVLPISLIPAAGDPETRNKAVTPTRHRSVNPDPSQRVLRSALRGSVSQSGADLAKTPPIAKRPTACEKPLEGFLSASKVKIRKRNISPDTNSNNTTFNNTFHSPVSKTNKRRRLSVSGPCTRDPAADNRIRSCDDEIGVITNKSLKEQFGDESELDFQMLKLDEMDTQPWVPVPGKPCLYVPPGVRQLVENMRRTLASEKKARSKAEERYLEEMRRRVALEDELAKLKCPQKPAKWL